MATPVTRVHQPTRAQAAAWELGRVPPPRRLPAAARRPARLLAYGLWVLESVTRNDVAGDPGYFVFRQTIYVAVGVVLLAVAAAVDPDVYRRIRWPLYAVADRPAHRGLRPRRGGARLEALDRARLLQLPALRARQDRARRRAGRRSSPTAGTGWPSGGRRSA